MHQRKANKCGPDYCAGTNNTHGNPYFCGDYRLGPKILPAKLPLASEIYAYDRLGGLCPGAFLAKWYNATAGSYIYPEQNGFQLNTANAPIDGNQTLVVGMKLDRFGSEYGTQLLLEPIGRMLMLEVQVISCRLFRLPISNALSRPQTSIHPPPNPHTRITIIFTRSSNHSTFSVALLLVSHVLTHFPSSTSSTQSLHHSLVRPTGPGNAIRGIRERYDTGEFFLHYPGLANN